MANADADPLADPRRRDVLAQTALLDSQPEAGFDRLTRLAAKLLRAPVALVSLVDSERQFFKSQSGLSEPWATQRQTPLSHSLCRHVVASGAPLIIPDARDVPLVCDNLAVTEAGVRAYAGVPLTLSDGSVLGSFCVLDYAPHVWTEDEVDTLTTLAASVVAEIELRLRARQARQKAEEAEAARARLTAAYEREHRIADTLQQTLLMSGLEADLPDLAVEPFYEAAWNEALVGGDFYDAFAVSETQVALAVGDASGKGLDAAVRIAQVKFALRAFLREYPSAPRALSRLNDLVCDAQRLEGQDAGAFVVLSLAVLDTETGQLTVTVAGAEPPILLRAGGEAEALTLTGFPLGVVPGQEYATRAVTLAPGDTLLLLTDGLTEARQDDALLEHAGVMDAARQALPQVSSLRDLGQRLLDAAHAFAGGPLHDDACLLLARWR